MRISKSLALILATVAAGCEVRPDESGAVPEAPREAQEARILPPEVRPRQRFAGELSIRTAEGPRPVRVEIYDWSISGGQEIDDLPLETRGFMIMQLRAGEVTTILDGERRERIEDEVWTVREGASLTLVTEDDTAVLQTIVITRGG